jgi:hypothetical protein
MNAIEYVTFMHYISIGRSTLETTIKSSDGFTGMLMANLAVLKPCSFASFHQGTYLKELKCDLQVTMLCNFAESYSFILQNENSLGIMPIRLFTLLCFFQESSMDELSHTSSLIISDCLTHDITTVHLSEMLTNFLQNRHSSLCKGVYSVMVVFLVVLLHGSAIQKTAIFVLTTMRTSNPMKIVCLPGGSAAHFPRWISSTI